MLFICTTSENPCPSTNQVLAVAPTLEEFAQLGITPEATASAFGTGFALVFFFACIGLAISTAVKTIKLG